MRLRPSFILALVCALAGPAASARYTLEQLLAKVRSDYPGVEAARESLAAAGAQLSQANRLYLPAGEISFGLTGSPNLRCVDPTSKSDSSLRVLHCIDTNAVDLRSGADALPVHGIAANLSLNLLQPIYTSGKIESARAAARAGQDAARANVHKEQADAFLSAVRVYFTIKVTRASEATLTEGLDKLGDWIKEITDSLEAGKSDYTENDLARLKIAVDNANLVLFDIRRNLASARSGLSVLTGDPQADVDDAELDVVAPLVQPLSFYEDSALLSRPETKLVKAAREAAGAFRRLRLAELFPDFGLAFSFNYAYASSVDSPANAFLQQKNALGVGLLLVARQPLDLAVRLARFSLASAEQRALEARRRQALGAITWDVDSAYANAVEARGRYDRTAHAEKVARGWYHAMDDQVGQTPGIGRDIAEAARNYFELRLRHLQSIMDVNVSVAALRRASGLE